ncbi:hypothetical protein MPTK1_2g00960 [Marchantia polymorpha subsp. ruderalis]|uniref:E3 ubiquitin-protein ligase n=1 Tax=Marchantia polymorpha TaxID=3197 RepID=A0A2R6X9F8_MARPO|nr:hypothetical protein MARPO_0028s0055 [Marchantia polymorpha]BBN00658.1 hypothetical protein Mp_2g00960 [Marchantia polymorpha subsp. ruderalis]|eukprot:PTQ42738.1 hypothetical protein MARPO_0028s0055 [Marchantia polymorpha]
MFEARRASMEQARWQTLEAANRGLMEIEHSMSGGEFFSSYLDSFKAGGQAQCTTVWTKTTIAYRCRTCQVNDSSAICVSCFQAGDHRHHDYVMYHSDSGGCCDCGDPAAWKEEGFCSVHRSSSLHKELTIPAHLNEVTSKAVELVLKELCIWVEIIMDAKISDRSYQSSPFKVTMAEVYVKWLQKICSVAALRNIVVVEITSVHSDVASMLRNDRTRNRSFLEILLSTYGRMPDSLMEAETTLFLQMLYDQQFKDTFSRALMRHYSGLIEPAAITPKLLGEYKALDQSLDRVMVQLFNVPEITLNLIQTDRLLESFTSVLGSVLSHCTSRRDGTIDVDHHAIKGKVYGRPQGDLKLIVAHESVAFHVLKERPDVFRNILSTLSLLQWMNPYSRSETVGLKGQEAWTAAITLEMNTMTIPFGLIGRCFSGFPGNEEAVKSALISAACVAMGSLREFLTKVETSQSSEEKLSLHIPLHRVLSAVISKLVMLPWRETGQGFLDNLQPALTEAEVLALMDHPLRVVVWMAEIRAHMWQRSSEDFSRLELIYRGSIWHDQSMDMDILMLQFCCVAVENMGQSVISMMAKKFGLLDMVTMPVLDSGGDSRESTLAKISMLQDFLRLLLLIIRERRNTGMFERESLRYDVIQWLCVRDQTYSQLAYTLGGNLIDQTRLSSVLQEVAIYNIPKVQERGFYQLKQECWKEFDPLFAHFYANDLEEAQERAISVGKLPHYWRLQPPREVKPPFNRLIKILHTQACHQLTWNVLHSVTNLIQDEATATSAEALGVMSLQILEMALADIRDGGLTPQNVPMTSQSWQVQSSSMVHCSDISDFIYAKPHISSVSGVVEWKRRDSTSSHPSIYEMLISLQRYKDSFRLVDSANHVIQLQCSYSITKSGSDSCRSQVFDVYIDDERRKLKKKRQEAILADFKARQKAFLDQVYHEEDSNEVKAKEDAGTPVFEDSKPQEFSTAGGGSSWAVPGDKTPSKDADQEKERHECAFCRSECDGDESPTGWIALVQRYNLPSLIHSRGEVVRSIKEVTSLLSGNHQSEGSDGNVPGLLTVVTESSPNDASVSGPLDLHPTEHVRCCGHQMHQMCFQRYADSLLKRHYAKSTYEGKGIIDLGKMDFLCPFCRRLANVLLPDVNKVVPWARLETKQELHKKEALQDKENQTDEELAYFSLEGLIPHGSSEHFEDMQYWKHYWSTHQDLAESIRIFAAQSLRVRKKFLREPPDLDGLPLCQILWETLAENIIHCEVETREVVTVKDIAASSSSSASASPAENLSWRGDAAHWLGLTELGKLAMLTNTMPCEGKQKKMHLLLQWLGFDENVIKQRFEDDIETPANTTQVDSLSGSAVGDISQHNQSGEEVIEKAESMVMETANEKSTDESRSPRGHKNYWESGSDDYRSKRNRARFKFAGADDNEVGWRLQKKHNLGKVLESSEPMDIGWLWSNSKASKSGSLASGDPFELLIMLLVTFEGWPTFQDLMAMVRVAYVLAATKASVAFNKLSGEDENKLVAMDKAKIEVLQAACLPFLRRVALMVQIIARKETRELANGQAIEWMESECLQQWLDLPKIQEAVELGMQGIHGVKMQQLFQNNQPAPLLYKVPRQALLTKLPEVFQELVLQNLKVACLNCHKTPHEPAICLVCGNLFCCGTDCCNIDGMGECYRHADKESAGVGIYLLIRSTQLVLLRSNRVCMAPSLYLDLHGEEDAYLKRGHPLHLCHLRLNEVRRLWLTASFDHETHILHSSQIGGRVL